MNFIRSFNRFILISLALLGLSVSSANAAVITWGSATSLGTGTDVSLNGTLVEAVNGASNSVSDQIVNGVTFESSNFLGNSVSASFCSSCTTDASYRSLLNTFTRPLNDGPATFSVGGGLLSINSVYEVQIWFVDDRPGGLAGMSLQDLSMGAGAEIANQFVIGTFTADSTSQAIQVAPIVNFKAHLNAYQVRAVSAVPVPAAVWLFGTALIGLVGFGKRRKVA